MPDQSRPPRTDPRVEGNHETTPPRGLGSIVRGAVQAPRPGKPLAPPLHPARTPTRTGLPAPPAPRSAPEPPSASVASQPKRKVSPAYGTPEVYLHALEQEVSRRGDELVLPPESVSVPAPSRVPDSLAAKVGQSPLLRKLAIIAGAATGVAGVITAIGNAVANVITASRPPSNAVLLERIEKLEKARAEDNGLKLEAEARRAKDAEHDAELGRLKAEIKTIDTPRIQGIAPAPSNRPDR